MKAKNLILRGIIAVVVIIICYTFTRFYSFLEHFFLNLMLYFAIGAFMVWAFLNGYRDMGFGILTGLFAVITSTIIVLVIFLFR